MLMQCLGSLRLRHSRLKIKSAGAWMLTVACFARPAIGEENLLTADDRWPGHTLGYRVAAESPQVRDDLLTPMRFAGVGGTLGIGWGYSNRRLRWQTDAGLAMSYLVERMGNPGAALSLWLLVEGYYRQLYSGANLTLDLGAVWRSRITQALLFSWDDAHLYYLAAHVLGPTISLSWKGLGRPLILMTLRLPFFGFAGRPPNERFVKQETLNAHFMFVEPHENPHLAFLHQYRSVDFSIGAAWTHRRSRFEIRYVLDYEVDEQPKPFRDLVHQIAFIHDIGIGALP